MTNFLGFNFCFSTFLSVGARVFARGNNSLYHRGFVKGTSYGMAIRFTSMCSWINLDPFRIKLATKGPFSWLEDPGW